MLQDRAARHQPARRSGRIRHRASACRRPSLASCESTSPSSGRVDRGLQTKQIFLLHSPGDEEYMGGCVSAGRGFAHITPMGDLTPCPVSNIATHNLTKASLREG
ncbi:MAG: hypothetical protein ACTSQ8_11175 [Candidatus Helarchaeota archaeon]